MSLSDGETLSATVGADGSWSVTPSTALPDGSYTAQAQQGDQAGNVGHSSSRTFRVDTVTPTMSLALNPSSPNGRNGIYKTMPAVHLTADDANFDSVSCTVDEGTLLPFPEEFSNGDLEAVVGPISWTPLAQNISQTTHGSPLGSGLS